MCVCVCVCVCVSFVDDPLIPVLVESVEHHLEVSDLLRSELLQRSRRHPHSVQLLLVYFLRLQDFQQLKC